MKAALLLSLLILPTVAAGQQGLGEFDQALGQFNGGRFQDAIPAFHRLAEGAADPGIKAKSEYYLGQSLAKTGLLFTASTYLAEIVRAGPGHPFYLEAVQALLDLQQKLDDPFLIPSVLHNQFREDWGTLPEPARSRMYYLVALMRHRGLKLEEARQLLDVVKPKSPVYAKAKYLTGVVLSDPRYPGGPQNTKALEAFQAVINLQGEAQEDLQNIRQLALLGVGRIHYGDGRYDQAVASYERVPRFSGHWDQALFENGFARFRKGDYGGALGSLQALHAPQFESAFQPESWLVKATIYYFSCLYEEAATAMKAFARIYNPMADQMKAVVEGQGEDFTGYFAMLTDPKDQKLPRQVKLWVRNNERIADLMALLARIDAEKAMLPKKTGSASASLGSYLDQNRETVVQTAGKLVRNRLVEATQNIRRFNQDGALIHFETTLAEKQLLEAAVDQRKILADQTLYRPPMPGEAWNYWQFQGEFWIDEIGYYQYTLKRGCPDTLEGQQPAPTSEEEADPPTGTPEPTSEPTSKSTSP
jgi:tetratricopeptide (TPR) repeat protein